jgi:hypothetical protein
MVLMCECLVEIPSEVLIRITSEDFTNPTHFTRGLFIRCYLISRGNHQFAWLNDGVEAFANNPQQ